MKNTMIPLFRAACWNLALLGGLSVGLFGCGSETVKKAIDKTKKAVTNTASKVKESVAEAGRPTTSAVSLTLSNHDEPLAIEGGKAFIAKLKDRPLVVNIESTSGKKGEYPKYFITFRNKATKVADLIGKSLDATMYFQETPISPMFATQLAKPARVSVTAGDEYYVTAKLESADLVDSTGQASLNITGTVTVLVPQPKPKEEPKAPAEKDKKKGPVSAADKMKAAEGGK
jgi:hypothetical protein